MSDLKTIVVVAATTSLVITLGLETFFENRYRGNVSVKTISTTASNSGGSINLQIENAAKLSALRDGLDQEREARAALELEVEQLRQQLAQQLASIEPDESEGAPEGASGVNQANEIINNWFNEDSLLELGVAPEDIERLKEQLDALTLDKLYLRDQASRQGWVGTSRYTRALQRMRAGLHEELGDEDFDRMLYATGQNNRVLVLATLANSAAAEAGIQPGDFIVGYNGKRVFDIQALARSTNEGEAGGLTMIEVQRDDELIVFYVPRGPLGTRFRPAKGAPVL